MAKELAWKASRAERPRGFESHALRQTDRGALRPGFLLPADFPQERLRPMPSAVIFLNYIYQAWPFTCRSSLRYVWVFFPL